jgi:hypothetical protein
VHRQRAIPSLDPASDMDITLICASGLFSGLDVNLGFQSGELIILNGVLGRVWLTGGPTEDKSPAG